MFAFLRSVGLDPTEWSQAIRDTGKAAPHIGEILDRAFGVAQAVVVLLTGDDEARLEEWFRDSKDGPHESQLTPQARPNVLFEAGMAIGRQPNRTILVQIGELRPFSDIAGLHILHMDDTAEKRNELIVRLQTADCPATTTGTDWLTEGKFSPSSHRRRSVGSKNVEQGRGKATKIKLCDLVSDENESLDLELESMIPGSIPISGPQSLPMRVTTLRIPVMSLGSDLDNLVVKLLSVTPTIQGLRKGLPLHHTTSAATDTRATTRGVPLRHDDTEMFDLVSASHAPFNANRRLFFVHVQDSKRAFKGVPPLTDGAYVFRVGAFAGGQSIERDYTLDINLASQQPIQSRATND